MRAQRQAHQSPLWRRTVALVLRRLNPIVLSVALLAASVAILGVLVAFGGLVFGSMFSADCGGVVRSAANAFVAGLCVFVAIGFTFAPLDGFHADFAKWKASPYSPAAAPVWVREIAERVRGRCPEVRLTTHELFRNQVVVDPVLEARCPVTGERFFLAVWDDLGQKVEL